MNPTKYAMFIVSTPQKTTPSRLVLVLELCLLKNNEPKRRKEINSKVAIKTWQPWRWSRCSHAGKRGDFQTGHALSVSGVVILHYTKKTVTNIRQTSLINTSLLHNETPVFEAYSNFSHGASTLLLSSFSKFRVPYQIRQKGTMWGHKWEEIVQFNVKNQKWWVSLWSWISGKLKFEHLLER